jgi:hypothetical protein
VRCPSDSRARSTDSSRRCTPSSLPVAVSDAANSWPMLGGDPGPHLRAAAGAHRDPATGPLRDRWSRVH